jgi:hypothetical protein
MNLKKLLSEMVTTANLSGREIPKRFLKMMKRKHLEDNDKEELIHWMKKNGLKKKS